ncbi:MAG TPA: penicillin-binding protein, partial [Candidatus Acidoferrales bacterium]|nr:penicillin-binding protein [Candidatus Acidoferrales bacterium]
NTGELLAVANWPTFDPNDAGHYSADTRMDRAIAAAYEPGSVFKVLTLAGAIENHLANPAELIDCQMGSIDVAGRIIHDWKRFGTLTVRDILVHSSDVGAIKVALRMGPERFYDAVRPFGIGQPTGIALPGENRGLFRPVSEWTPSSIGSIAMGQEVSVTPIQMISAISAVANGGMYYHPTIVRDIQTVGPIPDLTGPDPHRATDERTAAEVRDMMESVVLKGTGMPAKLDGYSAAGKSGTAQKIDPATGRYSATDYLASFAGFAPVNDPAVTILVVLDSPVGGHHGGEVGGPIFKRIAQQVLTYMSIPHDIVAPSSVEMAKNAKKTPQVATQTASRQGADNANRAKFDAVVEKQTVHAKATAMTVGKAPMVAVPNLTGQSVRSVIEACSRLGLDPALIGDGIAVQQFPEAGAQVEQGSQITVRFGRAAQLVPAAANGEGN